MLGESRGRSSKHSAPVRNCSLVKLTAAVDELLPGRAVLCLSRLRVQFFSVPKDGEVLEADSLQRLPSKHKL